MQTTKPMSPQAVGERNAAIAQLSGLINELESVAQELSGTHGIGAERCAASLRSLAASYRQTKSRLQAIY